MTNKSFSWPDGISLSMQQPEFLCLSPKEMRGDSLAPQLRGSGEGWLFISHKGDPTMSREDIYKEIESMFGLVPSMFKELPDSVLGLEWNLFRRVQIEEGAIPNKYRELLGLAVSAATKCRYCVLFHTEMAKLNGATEAEIDDALLYAKSTMGWSTFVNGLQLDFDQFKEEIRQACEFVKSKQTEKKEWRDAPEERERVYV
jgi:AhpD family alkylhydroperoxidase